MSKYVPLQKALLHWFSMNRRDLPWRHSYTPYQVWISEIMLQQTQMDRVVLFFKRWMEIFPDIHSLAAASEDQVLKMWEGLGYYSRPRNILKTATILVEKFHGEIPDTPQKLLTLPGIGPYTAGAVASIAFNRDAPVVDANIERIFARLFNIDLYPGSPEAKRVYWKRADEILPKGQARNFNQALMELGALVCKPTKPLCSSCPLVPFCLTHKLDIIAERPIPKKRSKTIPINMATGILVHKGKIFIQQRLADDVWGSLWEFPGGEIEQDESAEQTVVREFLEETEFEVESVAKITTTIHHYTRYKVSLHCFLLRFTQDNDTDPVLHAAQDFHWLPFQSLQKYAFPAGHRKLIQYLEETAHPLTQITSPS